MNALSMDRSVVDLSLVVLLVFLLGTYLVHGKAYRCRTPHNLVRGRRLPAGALIGQVSEFQQELNNVEF